MASQTEHEKDKLCADLPTDLFTDLSAIALAKTDGEDGFTYWFKKNRYYHDRLSRFYCFVVPRDMRVLHVNCKNGHLLNSVLSSHGVGIDNDEGAIRSAQQAFPKLNFYHSSSLDVVEPQTFDYIILSSVTMELYDVQQFFKELQRFCHADTRIVIDSYSYLWEPVLWLMQKCGFRRPTNIKNWVSQKDLNVFFYLTGFELITQGRFTLMPVYIPFFSTFCNTVLGQLPLINRLCLNEWTIARPKSRSLDPQWFSVSVIVPCRNEKGNIESAIKRIPTMGKWTEIVFVEGSSSDGTLQEIERLAKEYPEKQIRYYVQDGRGKGNAVRKGFAHARGDVLMILDADLTVPPEELPKFFDALLQGKGDFINGSRLVYGMESDAMRFLNLLANFFFGTLFSWLLGQSVKDTLCGTKVLWKKDYEKIVAHRSFFGDFDPFGDFDLIFGAAKLNLKIVDMPVHYKNRTYGSTQIRRFYHGWILLWMSFIGMKKFKFR